jgi:Response regulator containing a CheY-like receiver domain and an HTH DNA-binding domain
MKHAFIVEDTEEFQSLLVGQLHASAHAWEIETFVAGSEALRAIPKLGQPPDIALIDLGLPDVEGAEVIRALHVAFPDLPILVVSVYAREDKILEAVRAGAKGYLLKDNEQAIAQGVEEALAGNFPISPVVARHLFAVLKEDDETTPAGSKPAKLRLAPQELRILGLVQQGLSYTQVADEMGLALSTVQSYSRNLYRKLDVHSQTQALARARAEGLIS